MSSQYASIRDGLLEIVHKLSQINMDGGHKRLDELSEKLTFEQFNLVVMGQFKRGKSTLINALLGAEILPTSIVPLTSIVTILRYGRESKAVVRYLNDATQEISFSDIPKYVTEKCNPQNKLGVKDVEVFYPSDFVRDGVCIIDTPGVGSVFQHNTDVAYAYLPYVDAGIFIMTPDPPMGESEHRFLKDVRVYADKIFFILNKTDLVNDTDLAESNAFTADLLKKDLGQSVSICPVSAKLALAGKLKNDIEILSQSGFLTFENDLKQFLHREKGRTFLQSVISALLRYTAEETMACKLEQETARLSVEELRTKIESFENYARTTEKDRDQQRFILDGQIKKLHQILDDDLDILKADTLQTLLRNTGKRFLEEVGKNHSSHELEKEMENYVFEEIKAIFTSFRNKESEEISEALEGIYIEIAGRTNDMIERIIRTTADLFQIELKPFTTVEKLTSKSDFYFLLRDDPGAIELIRLSVRSALPVIVAKGLILQRMKATIAERFERHCGRVRYDLIRRIDRTSTSFRKSLNEKIDLTLLTIREALNRAVSLKDESEQEVSHTLSTLSVRLSEVSDIREKLLNWEKETTLLNNVQT